MSTYSRPLPPLKKYHFHIIYNHEQSPLSATEDNKQSLKYTERVVSILTNEGFDKSYYHYRDARPGRNIFTELSRLRRESQFTLLILTPGFMHNCWAKYASRSAFKQLLDKEQDHRVIALAFNLTDNQVPEDLCQHEILHFNDMNDDMAKWTKLVKVMVEDDNVAVPEHRSITEAGDNCLHTDSNNLMADPDGETSLSFDSLNIDGDRQGKITSYGDNSRGTNSAPGQTGLIQREESVEVDGDDSVHGTAGDGKPNTMEREPMTKELLSQKPVTLDLKSPSPMPVAGYSMSLEASPTASDPVVAKTLPPPSGVGRTDKSSNRTIEEKTPIQNAVHTEFGTTEKLGSSSLTDNSDLTFDFGGTSQSVNDGATSQTEHKVLFNGNREENLGGNLQLNIANKQSENRITDNERHTVSSSENADFQDLPLDSSQAKMSPESPESGYYSNMNTREVQKVLPAESVESVTTVYSDSSEGQAPVGEDADATFGDGGSAAGSSRTSLSEDKQTRSSSCNWSAFTVHCVSRMFSTTDSMFTYSGKPK